MPRQCETCASPSRDEIDQALLNGDSAAAVSARFRLLSTSSIARHRVRHLSNNIADRALIAPNMSTADLLQCALDAMNAARAISQAAAQTGRASLVLQSLGSVREAIRLIHELAGADGVEDVIEQLRGAEALAKAAAATVRDKPEFGQVLAAHLDKADARELADAVRRSAIRSLEKGK